MAIYNNGFPVGYQPVPPIYPAYQQATQTQQQAAAYQSSAAQPSVMTPPTIHAEIIQVEDRDAAARFPVGVGASQMMIAKDDSAIFVKTAFANGQYTLDEFLKQSPAPQEPLFDPGEYVRKDELEKRLESISSAFEAKTSKTDGKGVEE